MSEMRADLSDPNNHVPEASEADAWDDVVGGVALPPRRQRTEGGGRGKHAREQGVVIESAVQRVSRGESALEVQEIDGAVVRLQPEEAAVPKMPRQATFQERPAQQERREGWTGEAREWGQRKRQSLRWLVGTGVGVAVLVVTALLLLPAVNQSNAARPQQAQLEVETPEAVEHIEEFQAMFERQDEAEHLFWAYAGARIAADVVPMVREGAGLESSIRSRHRDLAVPKGWRPRVEPTWSVAVEGGRVFGVLDGLLPDFSRFSAYFIQAGNGLLLDWKATTAFGTADFGELAAGGGDASEIRGLLVPSGFYGAVFPEGSFRSYQLLAPDRERSVWVYSRVGEEVDSQVAGLFRQGVILEASQDPLKVTLRLQRGPEGALPNQWLIAEMLHKDWITP